MIEGCIRYQYGRGLCQSCYKRATIIMKEDNLTWDDLIDMGLVKGNFKSPFRRAYNKAKQRKKNDGQNNRTTEIIPEKKEDIS